MPDFFKDALLLLTLGLMVVVPLAAFCYGIFYLISLPLRRQERARILIDLLEFADHQHQDPEIYLKEIAATRDRSLGVRFHILGGYLEAGQRLPEALRRVPRLLPPSVTATLQLAESTGDFRKLLPICHTDLNDAATGVRNAAQHGLLLLLVLPPMIFIMAIYSLQVWPKFRMISEDYEVTLNPWLDLFVERLPQVLPFLGAGVILFYVAALFYVGGPRLSGWLERGIGPFVQMIWFRVPWYRKRILRHFSIMLSTLLDADVPESEALRLAAQSTACKPFARRVERCRKRLQQGEPLDRAMAQLDPRRELSWRLQIASRQSNGFRESLQGWWEWLHAKAQQQEHASAQYLSVAIILLNGTVAAVLGIGVFHVITSIFDKAALW